MANSKSMYWWNILLSVTAFLIISSKGTSVDLTIEGGVSLVGPHCPGVRLLCEGVELTSIRWRYNGNMNIISYFPDRTSTTQSATSAFFMPQLMAVERNPNNLNFANFSSSLTVNVSQLISNNVTEISCGAPGVSQAEPVNVSIIKPGVPNNPIITLVTAAYQSGELNSLEVTWKKSDNFCPSFGIVFTYEVNITTFDSVLVNHSSTNCGEVLCMVSFKNLTGETKEYAISIKAENELGSSDLVLYPFLNAQQIQQYFIPDVLSKDSQLFGRCTTTRSFAGNAKCFVRYTTDSMYRDLSTETNQPLNTEFLILKDPVSNTTYYFQFSLLVNNTLKITERTMFHFLAQSGTGIPSYGIALIVIATAAVIVCLAVLIVVISFLVSRQIAKKKVKGLTVFVDSFEKREDIRPFLVWKTSDVRPYTAYKVVITSQDKTKSHVVYRSYNNFKRIFEKVKHHCKWETEKLEFPDKDTRNQDCQEKLNNFIGDLMKIPGIQDFPPVQKFLSDKKLDPQTPIL